jgi:hypothetical protein
MKQTLFALSLGFGALILLVQHAQAQTRAADPVCGPRTQVVERLTRDYGESRRAMGLAGPSAVMEVYASTETGSWTVTMTLPDGRMCLIAAGQGYEQVNDPFPASGAPL